MASHETLYRLLSAAFSLLDQAASEIRETHFEPVDDNVARLAKAMAEIGDVQLRIHAAEPGLAPGHPLAPTELSIANQLLTTHMADASEFERQGNRSEAIATYEAFMALESTPHHRGIVAAEIERLRREQGE